MWYWFPFSSNDSKGDSVKNSHQQANDSPPSNAATKNTVTKDSVTSNASPKGKTKKKQKGALGLLMQYDSDSGGSAASIDSDTTSNYSISPLGSSTPSPPMDRLTTSTSSLVRGVNHTEANNNVKPRKRQTNKKSSKMHKTKALRKDHDAPVYPNHEASRYYNHDTAGYTVDSPVNNYEKSHSPVVVTTETSINSPLTSMYPSTGLPGYSFAQGPFPFQTGGYSYPAYPQYPPSSGYYQWAGNYPGVQCQSSFPCLNFTSNTKDSRQSYR